MYAAGAEPSPVLLREFIGQTRMIDVDDCGEVGGMNE
jgi:hypothetical protein